MATLSRKRRIVRAKPKAKPVEYFFEEDDLAFGRRYLELTVDVPFSEPPKHCLWIPACWARHFDAEFHLHESDFCTRAMAFGRAAAFNAARLQDADFDNDNGLPVEISWTLVFQIGQIEEGSFMLLEHGTVASMHLDTTFTLVQPTPDEIRDAMQRTAGRPRKAVAHA